MWYERKLPKRSVRKERQDSILIISESERPEVLKPITIPTLKTMGAALPKSTTPIFPFIKKRII